MYNKFAKLVTHNIVYEMLQKKTLIIFHLKSLATILIKIIRNTYKFSVAYVFKNNIQKLKFYS